MQNEKVVPDGRVPAIGQVFRCYRTIAAAERMKTGRPGAATMMLEFAMRNGDVLRLKPENFVERRSEVKVKGEGEQRTVSHYLCYVPHKTALSSGRRVCWPVHEDIWRRHPDDIPLLCRSRPAEYRLRTGAGPVLASAIHPLTFP